MALEDFSLDSAREKLEEWRLAKEKAESETQSIRTKLHSAVRKGKAIESERLVLAQKLQDLTADLAQGERGVDEQIRALQQHIDDLTHENRQLRLHANRSSSKITGSGEEEADEKGTSERESEREGQGRKSRGFDSEQHQKDIQRLEGANHSLAARLQESFLALQAAESSNSALEAQQDALSKRCTELEAALSEACQAEGGDQASIAPQNATDPDKVTMLQSKLKEAERQEQQLRQTATKLQLEVIATKEGGAKKEAELRQQLDKMREEIQLLGQNADLMREALQAAASRIQEAQAAEAVARSDAEASQATAEARDEEAASLRRQLAELEGTLAAQQDADAELSIYRATVERLREEVDGLNERLAERSLAAESEQRQRQDLQISLKESEASKEKLMTELAAAGQANDRAAEGLRTSLEQELASVREMRQDLDEQKAELARLQSQAEEQVLNAEERVSQVSLELKKAQADEAARKQRFGFLHSTFAKEKATMQEQLDICQREARSHRDALGNLQQVVAKQEEQLVQAAQQADKSDQRCKDMQLRVKELEGRLAEYSRKLEAAASESQQDLEGIRGQLLETKEELSSTRRDREQIKAQLSSAETEAEKLKRKLNETQAQLALHAEPPATASRDQSSLDQNLLEEASTEESSSRVKDGNSLEVDALKSDNAALQTSLDALNKLYIRSNNHQAEVAKLEKRKQLLERENQELHWQIAMLAKDPEAPPQHAPKPLSQTPGLFQEAADPESDALAGCHHWHEGDTTLMRPPVIPQSILSQVAKPFQSLLGLS